MRRLSTVDKRRERFQIKDLVAGVKDFATFGNVGFPLTLTLSLEGRGDAW